MSKIQHVASQIQMKTVHCNQLLFCCWGRDTKRTNISFYKYLKALGQAITNHSFFCFPPPHNLLYTYIFSNFKHAFTIALPFQLLHSRDYSFVRHFHLLNNQAKLKVNSSRVPTWKMDQKPLWYNLIGFMDSAFTDCFMHNMF